MLFRSWIVDALVERGVVADAAEIPQLPLETIMEVDLEKEIGAKTADRIIRNLERSREVPFDHVLFALGIRFVGETTAKYLAAHFGSLDALMAASREELVEADEVGEKIADGILDFFADGRNLAIIERLKKAGLQFRSEKREPASAALAGKRLVISGRFSRSRDEMKALVERHGGKNLSAVSSGTDYLVAGEKTGPEKLKKAEKYGVRIISESEFFDLLAPAQQTGPAVAAGAANSPEPKAAEPEAADRETPAAAGSEPAQERKPRQPVAQAGPEAAAEKTPAPSPATREASAPTGETPTQGSLF